MVAASFAYISEVTDESTRSRRVSIAEGEQSKHEPQV